MASTYSTSLRFELMAQGENSNTWGTKANVVFQLIEDSIAGYVAVAMGDANVTLTTVNGATDQARNMVLKATGVNTATRDLIAPSKEKLYVIHNATTGSQSIRIIAAGVGVTVANGDKVLVYCDGTDFYQVLDPTLAALGGLTSAANKIAYFTGSETAALADFSSYGRSIVAVADLAAFKTLTSLTSGTDIQAYSAFLAAIVGLSKTDGNFIVTDGSTYVAENGSTARTSLGLGSIATQASSAVAITGGTVTGITDLAVADGGTGSSTALGARTNLGVGTGDSPTLTALTLTNGQVVFPAVQVTSADANTLDDYEEGSGTVTASFQTPGTSSFTYTVQTYQYTKVGNRVDILITMSFTPTIGTGSSNLILTMNSFPFTAGATAIGVVGSMNDKWTWPTSATQVYGVLSSGSTGAVTIGAIRTGGASNSFTASSMTTGQAHAVILQFTMFV